MATTLPLRRFNVEPIETTTKSSKQMLENVDEPKPQPIETSTSTTTTTKRRFAVEPIETTTRSSKDTSEKDKEKEGTKRPARFTPEPVETSHKTNRRFAPEPIETSVRSSKDQLSEEKDTKPRRKFLPQPVETSERKSRKKFADEWNTQITKPQRKFAPEPVETSLRSSRKKFADEWDSGKLKTKKQEKKAPRKFAPQLIETASRSRRAAEVRPRIRRSDETKATPTHDILARSDNTPTFDFSQNPLFLEIQRATSPLNRRRMVRARPSQHCFHVPDLDPIESSESEGETPSPLTSPSTYSCRPYCYEKHTYKEPTRMRESVDERTSGYLLELAAKAAEKQLREQEMAAFPNGNYYEHVDHFVDAEDDSTRGSTTFGEINWDLKAMREYRENQEDEEPLSGISPGTNFKRPPWSNTAGVKSEKDIIGFQKNEEMAQMKRDASPPMLGKDIEFPRCNSPEPARFDTTQGCDAVRIAMCYLSEQTQQEAEKGESLWCGKGNGRQTSRVSSLWSTASSQPEKKEGLWAGCCVKEDRPKGPSGILTPRIETGDLLSPCPTPSRGSLLPPTPPASNADFACIDEKLTFALSIDEDYGDDFVTQVYNYLSLGYPSMAQPFDEELSRISNIPVSDLRQDDDLAESKGYIRLGPDGNLSSADITEESCMRWRALRVYIREWAKQHPNMAGDGLGGAGITVRKGSWAV